MKLSAFNFSLPDKQIAKYPPEFREDARLMVVRRNTGKITHHTFKEITKFFSKGDVLVLNNTSTRPAYFNGYKEKTSAPIQMILLRELDKKNYTWEAMLQPARKIRAGNKLIFGDGQLIAEVIHNIKYGRTIRFTSHNEYQHFLNTLQQLGAPPMLHILGRDAEPQDTERYKTVYGTEPSTGISPITGLHFTTFILKYLQYKDIHTPHITLHISYSILSSLEAEDLNKYEIVTQDYIIPNNTAQIVNQAIDKNKKICAVDLSTLQALETSISSSTRLKAKQGSTNKFLRPPYTTKIANTLLTNFYSPRSIPLINTAAFAGYDLIMKKVYPTAIAQGYRFHLYGDALLIL